jgi:hypothetical protein
VIEIDHSEAAQNRFDLVLPPTRVVAQDKIEATAWSYVLHANRNRGSGLGVEKLPGQQQSSSCQPNKISPGRETSLSAAHPGPDVNLVERRRKARVQ